MRRLAPTLLGRLLPGAHDGELAAALPDLSILPLADCNTLPVAQDVNRRGAIAEQLGDGRPERSTEIGLLANGVASIALACARLGGDQDIALRVNGQKLERHSEQPTTSRYALRCKRITPAQHAQELKRARVRAALRRGHMTPAQRAEEQKRALARAIRRRVALIIELAPNLKCAECGRQAHDPAELTVDHIHGKAWRAGKLSSSQRVARYWREYRAGVLMRALCGPCNALDGNYRRYGIVWTHAASDGVPF